MSRAMRKMMRLPAGERALVVAGVAALLVMAAVAGAEPGFEPLLAPHGATALLEQDATVFAGLDGAGLAFAPADAPESWRIWHPGEGLGGGEVTDLAWSGRYLWVATADGGLTRIEDPAGEPSFRQYTSNLGSLDVTAVAGTVIGQGERVYYGMREGGIGRIIDGISGNIYTAEQDGLVDDRVTSLALLGEDLFIGTETGVSLFSGNTFTTINAGLPDTLIHDLAVTGDGAVAAATDAGVFVWDPDAAAWSELGSFGRSAHVLAADPGGLYALNDDGSSALALWDGQVWTDITLPYPTVSAVAAGANLWVAGRRALPGMGSGASYAWYARGGTTGGFASVTLSGSLVRNAEGVAFDSGGGAWVGSYVADAVSGLADGQWQGIYELDANTEDARGLFNYYSNILSMAGDPQGRVWIDQYTTGLIRHDPATGLDAYFTPQTSGLSGAYILDMVFHPDGPLILTHDIAWQEGAQYDEKVDILLDPDRAEDPGQWITLPTDTGGITSTNRIWSALVVRRDVIWFAAEDYGLLRWDINGDGAGPDDPLTWDDFGDDRWDGPLDAWYGTGNDPKRVHGLALAPDGTIWAGGNGLVRFSYDESARLATVLETYTEKTSNFLPGLVSAAVSDVAVDGNGDVWVACSAGLNRVRRSGGQVVVDAWLDLGNYLANPNFGLLYSTGVIAPLPGTTYRDLAVSPDGRRVLLSADRGAALITVDTPAGSSGGGVLDGVHCYPNPWVPTLNDGYLKLGGLPAAAADGGVEAVVYTLEGERVYRTSGVLPDTGFWDGRNRFGDPVATGMYVLRVSWRGQSVAVPLNVVR